MNEGKEKDTRKLASVLKELGLDTAGVNILTGKARLLLEYQEEAAKKTA